MTRSEYETTLSLMDAAALHRECVLRHELDLRRGVRGMPSRQWDACLDECMRRGVAASSWQRWREEARAKLAERDRPLDAEAMKRLLT